MTEFEMDRRMGALLRMMLAGTATPADESEYQHLLAARAKRMTLSRPCPCRIRLRRET